ncbi:tyrosine-type recombinase/integrase [Methylocella silvestris]|uniref:Tyr recombinase domain-containing protein n=1 Tax=Methylocella silvestris TaxID=199596 RepID=A0A2J7THJ4_METSI|nr:site-specific integrase [Methylocella silvestris]PNG26226.1 hypothetical protein CR492_08860 [Methylocella silvestris]
MPKRKLTDAFAADAQLDEGSGETIYWDTDVTGFGLRLRPGSKTWIMAFRPAGAGRAANMKKLKLSTFPSVKTLDARRLAREMAGRVAAGEDPAAERVELKRKEASSVEALLDRYDADLGRRGYVNRVTVIGGLRNRLAPFKARDVKAVSGADLWTIIEALQTGGMAGAAEDFRSRARAFFTWCVKSKALQTNPLLGYRKERATRADRISKQEHGRALSDVELAKIWQAASLSTAFGRLLRFLILTGCRRGEAAGLTWSMVDREGGVINLPAAFVKQGRGHAVPIAPALADLMDACPLSAGSDLVFASARSGGAMSGWSDLMGALSKSSGVDFKLHDLRRTFRTGLSRLSVEADLAELALGHARSGLEARYNRDAGLAALRTAFELWADHVGAITRP